jgi:glucose-1-phosphate adenylyltransferase
MKDVLGLILGGGQGTRLYPLTKERAKPAVPLAGKYRLIDIPMSNCFHAGIEKIAILTQFNSVSLHRHIYRTYIRDAFAEGWVQILAAEQTPLSRDWYQGTADAVRKQKIEIREANTRYVLILAGDHLYRMDYSKFLQYHVDTGADITVAVQPVGPELAPGLGILTLARDGRIVRFSEKPKPDQLAGLESSDDPAQPFMASMGIYVFATDLLFELLDSNWVDFGKDIIPSSIEKRRVMGYVFDGYWEDIGTIKRFYEVNLEMAQQDPPFDFYNAERPIYTHARFLPASQIHGCKIDSALLTDGCRIYDTNIDHCSIGLRSTVGPDVTLRATVMMGADYYETQRDLAENRRIGQPNIGIGSGSVIECAIIDKNARIGRNVVIRAIPNRPDADSDSWVARDGIICVPKGASIPDNTVI